MAAIKNIYGDSLNQFNHDKGTDIATQRLDDLDRAVLAEVESRRASGQLVVVADLGCGLCGMANRLAEAGAVVDAVDMHDYADAVAAATVRFIQGDLAAVLPLVRNRYSAVVCQRMLHYLSYPRAVVVMKLVFDSMTVGGLLGLSASGLESELVSGYAGADQPLSERYDSLSLEMQQRHNIRGPVCLYTAAELAQLVRDCGFQVSRFWTSEFGNAKVLARKV